MMKMKQLSLFFLLLMLLPVQAWAQPTVQALVDRTRLAPGESLSFKVIIKDGSGDVDTSNIKDFAIVSQRSGTSISLINGSLSRTKEYAYTLIPQKTGKLTIPALPVKTGDGIITTSPISIIVTKEPEGKATPQNSQLFLRAELSAQTGYVGQQMVYTVSVFQAIAMSNAQLKEPEFPHMLVEKIDDQTTFDKVINGRSFRVTQLSFLLTPNKEGTYAIGPATLSCEVAEPSRGRADRPPLFRDPFFSQGRRTHKVCRSNALNLNILELPARADNLPPFSGLVGQFSIDASLESGKNTGTDTSGSDFIPTLATGESITLTITVSGTGNIPDAPPPNLYVNGTCKTYADEPVTRVQVTPSGTVGSKTFSYALVPIQAGTMTIPPIALNWFDPKKQTYDSMSTRPITLSVIQGETPVTTTQATHIPPPFSRKQQGQGVTVLHKDILPLYEDMDALQDMAPLPVSVLVLCLLLPPLAVAGLWIFQKQRQGRKHPGKRYRIMAQALLKKAQKQDADALTLCSRALMAAIASRTHILSESLTYDEALDIITETTRDKELGANVKNLMLQLDTARYGASSHTHALEQTRQLIAQTRNIVEKLCA